MLFFATREVSARCTLAQICYDGYIDMHEPFETTLRVGGNTNSLGKTHQVIREVLQDKHHLDELYRCMFSDDAWIRMRAADAFEKVCREHPEWITPYIDRLQADLSDANQQASIKWHLAQIYSQAALTPSQTSKAIAWLKAMLSSPDIDWIVAAESMKALAYFTNKGAFSKQQLLDLLAVQCTHASKSVVKKAQLFIDEFSG